ncbi:alkaline phosphatase family protein [Ralstonia holmesii]|uniref:alkaline phosphatase family protein n=1 Tax=Ralstonia holmesii TaxID=3058602 RepID=UPI003D64CBBA
MHPPDLGQHAHRDHLCIPCSKIEQDIQSRGSNFDANHPARWVKSARALTTSDTSACCGEPTGPNSVAPGLTGPGGGRVGAVVLSPFIKPGTVSNTPYNHYALLKSIEDVFGLSHLGYAGMNGLQGFGSDVYTAAH